MRDQLIREKGRPLQGQEPNGHVGQRGLEESGIEEQSRHVASVEPPRDKQTHAESFTMGSEQKPSKTTLFVEETGLNWFVYRVSIPATVPGVRPSGCCALWGGREPCVVL